MTNGSLWGDLSNLKRVTTPKTILREQAAAVGQATDNVVHAQVSTVGQVDDFQHRLEFVAPGLNNYTFTVATVLHGIDIYPCVLRRHDGDSEECKDEAALGEKLGTVLSSDRTHEILASLVSQST